MAEEEWEIGERLRRICGILERAYGEKAVEPRNPVEVLVRTILSQNTNEKNTEEAFKSLTARFKYEELLAASEEEIADAIRKGGLGRIKARRLKTALSALKNASMQRSGMQRNGGQGLLPFLGGYGSGRGEEISDKHPRHRSEDRILRALLRIPKESVPRRHTHSQDFQQSSRHSLATRDCKAR
ncbi:MAG: Endonuclease III [Methanophagales archaeon]|nr:hypothetical protein [Methanophagales archaeon]MCU4139314.1 Endonuclease III [Methanophagales archaeon]